MTVLQGPKSYHVISSVFSWHAINTNKGDGFGWPGVSFKLFRSAGGIAKNSMKTMTQVLILAFSFDYVKMPNKEHVCLATVVPRLAAAIFHITKRLSARKSCSPARQHMPWTSSKERSHWRSLQKEFNRQFKRLEAMAGQQERHLILIHAIKAAKVRCGTPASAASENCVCRKL